MESIFISYTYRSESPAYRNLFLLGDGAKVLLKFILGEFCYLMLFLPCRLFLSTLRSSIISCWYFYYSFACFYILGVLSNLGDSLATSNSAYFINFIVPTGQSSAGYFFVSVFLALGECSSWMAGLLLMFSPTSTVRCSG